MFNHYAQNHFLGLVKSALCLCMNVPLTGWHLSYFANHRVWIAAGGGGGAHRGINGNPVAG